MEDRFVDLESKVAYLEYNLEGLNEVVTGQQREIDQLTQRVAALINHIQSGSGGPQMDAKDEPPPPHY